MHMVLCIYFVLRLKCEICFLLIFNRVFKLEPSSDGKGHLLKELINIKIGDGSQMSPVSSLSKPFYSI